jgi:spermidine synthase
VNLLIAGAVFALDRRARDPEPGMSGPEARQEVPDVVVSSRGARIALWAIGLSGFCALALEVLWTRALVFFLDNSTHAFTTILTAFLLGIGLGSALIAKLIDTRKRLLYWLGAVEVLIGIFAILAIPILSNSTPVIQTMARMNPADAMLPWKWMGMRFATTLTVMLVPTILIGMTFPIVGKIYTRTIDSVGTALGRVYAVNTLGGVFGSAAAGFVLVPLIGVQASVIAVSALNTCVGIALILFDQVTARRTRLFTVVGSGAVFLALGALFLRESALSLTSYTERIDSAEVLSYEEGIGATVKVFRDHYGDKLLSINGFPVAGTPLGLHDAQKPLAHLPLLLSPVPSPKVNLIGFGAGGASWGVLQYDVERVDCVELVPAVPNAAEWFPEINHGVLSEPRFNLIMGDGRNYALVADEKYDVISIDATSPKMAGNGALYSLEFYQLLKERLTENGLAVQWIPFHLLSEEEVRMTARTFIEVFPHTTLWLTALRQHAILVGTQEQLRIDFAALKEKIEDTKVQRDLESLKVTDAIDFLSWYVMGENALREYAGDAPLNTDNHPYLEFTPAMAYFVADQYRVENLRDMRESRESVLPLLTNLGSTEEERAVVADRVRKRFESTQHSLIGDMLLSLNRRDEAIVEYNLALVIDPDDKNWMNPIWRDVELQR